MRISVIVSFLILIIGAGLAWHLDQRLAAARSLGGELVSEAARSGISIDTSNPSHPFRTSKRLRESTDNPVQLAAKFQAVSKEIEMLAASGAKLDEALQKRSEDLRKRMRLLDFSQMKILITELHANDNSANGSCQSTIASLCRDLAVDRPQAALALLMESPDLVKDGRDFLIVSAMTGWAKESPLAAFDWIQKNGGQFAEKTTLTLKRAVIYGAAVTDPKLSFDLLRRSGMEEPVAIAANIMSYPRTPEARTAALAAYREYSADMGDANPRKYSGMLAVGNLTDHLAKEGFAAASQWLAGAGLTPEELKRFAARLPYSAIDDERGQWVDWIGKNLPPEMADGCIWENVSAWTKADYQAAGKWLASTPDSPTKIAAIRAYAGSVATTDTAAATKWAMTLPPGRDRDETLKAIHRNWPKDNPAGAAAFAKEHAIK